MRAREITEYRVDEGVIDSIQNIYKTSKMGQQRQASAAEAAAEKKFALNIATLITRAIQSGSVLQQAPTQQPPQAPQPSVADFKPMTTAQSNDNASMASGMNESRQYRVFDTLLEYLIDEAPIQNSVATTQIKPGSITNLVKSYVNNLVQQYKWQDNPELREHSDKLAGQIEATISNPDTLKKILASKGSATTQQIYQASKQPIDQLFSTMYQWEQVGQSADSRQQAQQSSSAPASDNTTSNTRAEIPSTRQRETIGKLGEFLSKAKDNPEILTSKEMEPYRETLKKLAARL